MSETETKSLSLRIKCSECNRTMIVTLPDDVVGLSRQLNTQRLGGWMLSRVSCRSGERHQPDSLVEPLCPVCEESWMRYPP